MGVQRLGILCLLAALPPPDARAADPDPETVVVTATRSAARALEAPASISRLDGAGFAGANTSHQADLLNQVPGGYVQRGSGAESLMAIRSPVLSGAGACGAFLVAEDSLPIRPVGFCNVNEMFEVNYEQAGALEVLRGPGSALFGASAVHGVVNVLTPEVRDLPGTFIAVSSGADDFRRLGVGQRLGESAGVYGVATRAPGWRDASGVDELKLNVLADHRLGDGHLQLRAAGTVLNQETAGFVQGFEAYRDPTLARSNPNPEAFRDASSARVAVHYRSDSGENSRPPDYYELHGLYRRSRMDFSQHFLIGKPVEHNAQTSYLVSGARHFQREHWSARLAFDAEIAATELTEFQSGPATEGSPAANAIRPAGFHYNYTVAARTLGATASLDRALSAHWRASVALRADTTRYDYDNRMLTGNTDQNGVPCTPAGCLYARPADRDDRFNSLSPRLTLGWLDGGRHVYLSASSGFRPPEMTELYRLQRQQTLADLDSERLDAVELGYKHQGAHIDTELAGFAMNKRAVILRESNGFTVSNGRTHHRGVEYRLTCARCGAVRHPCAITLSGTFARHTYGFSRAVEGGETIVSGNDVDTAPRQLHSLDVAYPVRGDAEPWQVGARWNYVGSYFLDAANTARYPGHQVVDLRLAWRPARLRRQIALSARIDNLFDTAYADRADFAFGNYRYFPARGRAAFVTIDYQSD